MTAIASFLLRLPFACIGAFIGLRYGKACMFVCGMAGAGVADVLISML
jgi:hypothetical protein